MPPHPAAVEVRPLQLGDVHGSADLQHRFLPDSFFARLGPGFLRAYHRTFVESPHALGFAATVSGRQVGFLVGTTHARMHYSWVLRHHGLRLAVIAVAALLLRPRLLKFFLQTRARRYLGAALKLARRRPAAVAVVEGSASAGAEAQLTHVAVSDEARGAGAGRRLVECFEHHARRAGCSRAYLLTRVGDSGARAFYERLGWSATTERVDGDGRAWTRMETLL